MKKVSDVFKSIRFAKGEPRGKPHSSTDDEEHGAVGEKEFNQQVQHVKKRAMQEEKKDKYDEGEYDQEGDMAKSDLRSIIANAQKLHDMIDDADNLPEWVQSKITVAEDYISTVANYMTAEMNEAVKKPNATTRHLRQYPVSDKDVAKPVFKDPSPMMKDSIKQDKIRSLNNLIAVAKVKGVHHKVKEYESELKKLKEMAEEIEQLDELSPSLLDRAAKKASKNANLARDKGHDEAGDEHMGQAVRLRTGYHRAVERDRKKASMASMSPAKQRKYAISQKRAMGEETEYLEEKNKPTNPELWSRAVSMARSKFDVYPSAYANAWAAKEYKKRGGSWGGADNRVKRRG